MTTTESRHTVFWEIPDYLMKLKSFCRDYVTELDLNRYDTYLQLLVQLDKNSEKLQNALKKEEQQSKKYRLLGQFEQSTRPLLEFNWFKPFEITPHQFYIRFNEQFVKVLEQVPLLEQLYQSEARFEISTDDSRYIRWGKQFKRLGYSIHRKWFATTGFLRKNTSFDGWKHDSYSRELAYYCFSFQFHQRYFREKYIF